MTASAADQASFQVSGSSTVTPGESVDFQVSVQDASVVTGGLEGIQFDVRFDSNILEYKSSASLLSDSWQLRSSSVGTGVLRIVLQDNDLIDPVTENKSVVRINFQVKSNAEIGKSGKITLTDVVGTSGVPDFDSVDVSAGECSYTVQKAASSNNYLKSMTLNTGTLKPAFNKNTLSYQCSVPYSVSSITVSAAAEDSAADVSVSNAQLKAGGTTQVVVTVTAEDGQKRNYTINVSRGAAPVDTTPASSVEAQSQPEEISSEEQISSETPAVSSEIISSESPSDEVSSSALVEKQEEQGGFPVVGIIVIIVIILVIAGMAVFIILDQKKKKGQNK